MINFINSLKNSINIEKNVQKNDMMTVELQIDICRCDFNENDQNSHRIFLRIEFINSDLSLNLTVLRSNINDVNI